ncbi:hypothetical protein C8Q76DRAFT_113480 [Earliella scabrosa]|nr:hypothetical protein C8Q76DRAFT_113480 [Earliella scabrosa]
MACTYVTQPSLDQPDGRRLERDACETVSINVLNEKKPTLVFCVNIAHVQDVTAAFWEYMSTTDSRSLARPCTCDPRHARPEIRVGVTVLRPPAMAPPTGAPL